METINIFLSIIAILVAGLSLFIANARNTNQNKLFSLFILSISLWIFGILSFRNSFTIDSALYFSHFYYIIAATIPAFFLHFSYLFPTEQIVNYKKKILIYLPTIFIFIGLMIEPHLILQKISISSNGEKLANVNQITYWIYAIYFITYVVIAYINLFKSYKNTENIKIKAQLRLIFLGTIVPYIFATFFDLFLPPFDYSYIWIGPLLGFVVTCVLVYSIHKHHFLNVKVITAEFFTISLWVFIFTRILLTESTQEIFTSLVLLILSIIFGILLIRSVLLESLQKEQLRVLNLHLEQLNLHLEQKVQEKTLEVKRAYELEKKARRDLEKLNETKDQFILITQHNIRTPVMNIQTEIDSIISDDYDVNGFGSGLGLKTELNKSVENIKINIARLSKIVDDFLNITTLKVGSQILNISSKSILPIIQEILLELRIDLENIKIKVSYSTDEKDWPEIKIDSSKIKEVLLIIIENAIRYNTKNGSIFIKNRIENNNFILSIKNTGVGITPEDKGNLFSRLFFRSSRARHANPIGMGIGLSVARAIAEAHHGNIEISSEGENRGAEVVLTLPLDFISSI